MAIEVKSLFYNRNFLEDSNQRLYTCPSCWEPFGENRIAILHEKENYIGHAFGCSDCWPSLRDSQRRDRGNRSSWNEDFDQENITHLICPSCNIQCSDNEPIYDTFSTRIRVLTNQLSKWTDKTPVPQTTYSIIVLIGIGGGVAYKGGVEGIPLGLEAATIISLCTYIFFNPPFKFCAF